MSSQQHDILVLLDFELTGYGSEAPQDVHITEMAYIIFDVSTGIRLEYNQVIIKPESGVDAKFYERTGFSPTIFDEADTLATAVSRLDEWLYAYAMREHKTYCICTWGNRKLQEYFRADCERQGVKLALHYLHFYDLQEEVAVSMQNGVATGFTDAMKAINVELNPIRRRSGYDMCEVLESVVKNLQEKKVSLLNMKTINPSQVLDQAKPFTTPLPTDQSYGALVRVRGIPFTATESELKEFFKDYELANGPNIQSVKMLIQADARPSGEAVVRFADCEIAEVAIKKLHRQPMVIRGRPDRYLELSPLTEESARLFIQQTELPPSMRNGPEGSSGIDLSRYEGFFRLRGLPFSATVFEVVAVCLPNVKITKDQVVLGYGIDGRPSGDAYIAVPTKEMAEKALQDLDNKNMGNRYLESMNCTREDFQRVLRGIDSRGGFGGGRNANAAGNNRNMHHHHHNSHHNNGHQQQDSYHDRRGRHNGERTHERSDRFDNNYGNRRFNNSGNNNNSRYGHPHVLEQNNNNSVSNNSNNNPNNPRGTNTRPPTAVLKLRGLPWESTPDDVLEFFSNFHMLTVVPMIYNKNRRPIGEAYVEFASVEEAQRAVREKNMKSVKDRYIELFYVTKEDMLAAHSSIPAP